MGADIYSDDISDGVDHQALLIIFAGSQTVGYDMAADNRKECRKYYTPRQVYRKEISLISACQIGYNIWPVFAARFATILQLYLAASLSFQYFETPYACRKWCRIAAS